MWWGDPALCFHPMGFLHTHRPCVRARLVSIPSSSVGHRNVLLPSWASVSPFVDTKLFVGSCSHPSCDCPGQFLVTGVLRGCKEPGASPGCCRYSCPAGEGTSAFGTAASGKESSQLGREKV